MIKRGTLFAVCALSFIFISSYFFRAHPPEIRIAFDWAINPHHAPLLLAKSEGFFKKHGLSSITFLPAIGSSEGCKQIGLKTVQYALASEPQGYIQRFKGIPLEGVAKLIDQPLEVMISCIPLSQLKGKTVGHSSTGSGFTRAALNTLLKRENIKPTEIKFLYARQSLVSFFLTKTVDVLVNGWKTYELPQILQHVNHLYVYSYQDYGVPHFSPLVVFRHCDFGEYDVPFCKALEDAMRFIRHDPAQAFQAMIKAYPELNTALNRSIWPHIWPLFSIDFRGLPSNKPLQSFLKEHGLIN